MGRPDPRQPRLTFDNKKTAKKTPAEHEERHDEAADEASSGPDTNLQTILTEMRQGFATIADKVDTLKSRMDNIAHKLDNHESRLKEAEQRISDSEDVSEQLKKAVTQMDKLMRIIDAKNEDIEARNRRNNVRILGIPESTNTGRLEHYVERLLSAITDEGALSPQFVVERAHRSLGPRPQPGMTPRPIIARLLNYRDRDVVLRVAREKKQLHFDGVPFTIFPDFTARVQEERRKFNVVKQKLRQEQVDYALLYPARLRITYQGTQSFHTTPQSVDKFLKSLKKKRKNGQTASDENNEESFSGVE